jgi:hypothetical protein
MRAHALPAAFLALATVGCAGMQRVEPVREGVLYRSGQLSPTQLEVAVREHDIRTVVNLRGKSDAKWYREQAETLKDLKVKQVDMPVGTDADPEAVAALLATFKGEEKPILVHSYWSKGAAGFASAIYRVGIARESPDEARKELAFWQDKRFHIIPGAEQDRFLAEWKGKGHAAETAVAAKRKAETSLEDFGLDGLDKPKSEYARGPRRWPWSNPSEERDEPDESERSAVVLGPPKALTDERVAERSDRLRY